MTYDIDQLRELERRLSEATLPGPADTDELGVAVYETLGICSYIPDEGDPTRSLDAAIALVERVLPGFRKGIEQAVNSENGWKAWVQILWGPESNRRWEGHGHTPALALCLALVRALIAKEGK